jgi:hypothetical protein
MYIIKVHTHTHTHTHIYIYIYVCVFASVTFLLFIVLQFLTSV